MSTVFNFSDQTNSLIIKVTIHWVHWNEASIFFVFIHLGTSRISNLCVHSIKIHSFWKEGKTVDSNWIPNESTIESAVLYKGGSRSFCANVYYVTSSTNEIGKNLTDLQKQFTFHFLATENTKDEIYEGNRRKRGKVSKRKPHFQNGRVRTYDPYTKKSISYFVRSQDIIPS